MGWILFHVDSVFVFCPTIYGISSSDLRLCFSIDQNACTLFVCCCPPFWYLQFKEGLCSTSLDFVLDLVMNSWYLRHGLTIRATEVCSGSRTKKLGSSSGASMCEPKFLTGIEEMIRHIFREMMPNLPLVWCLFTNEQRSQVAKESTR